MITTLDKAWAAGLAAGIMIEVMKYVTLNEQLETALTALIAFGITWLIPNKE